MKISSVVGAILLAGCAAVTFAQTQTDVVKPIIITGEVVRYEPGQIIVVRSADKGEVSYTLMPSLTVPADVQVGRTVSLHTEPGAGGATVVKRITTTSVTPSGNVKRTTEETRTSPSGETTTTRTTQITGEVVRFDPGKMIVLRLPDAREMTYTFAPGVTVPTSIEAGRRVTLYTEPGSGGSVLVRRVVTTSLTPEGNVQRTTEETRTSPTGETSRTTTTSISGTVQAYEAGKSITIGRPDGTEVTYVINEQSQLPAGIAIGRGVILYPSSVGSGTDPMVKRVVYTKTKTKTKHGKTRTETKTKTETQQP